MSIKNSAAGIRYFYIEAAARGWGDRPMVTRFSVDGLTTTDAIHSDKGITVLNAATAITRTRGASSTTVADFKAAFADLATKAGNENG